MGYSPWGHKELDMTESLTLSLHVPWKEYGQSQKARMALGETHSTECGPSEKARGAYAYFKGAFTYMILM